jgi:phage terminase large subunit-like protein
VTPKQKKQVEEVLHHIPGYNPWDQAGDAWLDHDAAIRAINFFPEKLKHIEGAARGEPFILRQWQAAIVGNLFGWKRKDDAGRVVRRYRKSFIMVGRGNGKSPLAAGIVLYAFYEDNEPGAQCFLAAGQREQAGTLFRNAQGMVEQDKGLLSRTDIYAGAQHRSLILKSDPLSFCKVIPADAKGQHGGIPHCAIIDELHVQESPDLLYVFETAMAKKVRAQPLLVMITTSDYERPSICNEVYDQAAKVRDNGGDKGKPGYSPSFLPVIYEADKDDAWQDESVWIKANPNLGVSVQLDSLREACQKAQENPAFENEFRRLHLNQRTSQDKRIIVMDEWKRCAGERSLKELREFLKGKPCVGGLDLASMEDLASLALIFPLEDEEIAILSWSWCPADKVKRRARMQVPYDVWAKQGLLQPTDPSQIAYEDIRATFDALTTEFDIRNVGVDPAAGGKPFAASLCEDYGETFAPIIPQTLGNLSGPFKEFLRRIKMGKVIHAGNSLLAWQAGNVAAYYKGTIPTGADLADHLDKVPIMPSKQASADKIDAIAAIVDAFATMGENPVDSGKSVYETRGVIYVGSN